jgi:FAD/FMN-containing dehydrogenase
LLGVFGKHYGDALSKFEIMSQFCVDTAQKNIPQTRAPLDRPAPWHVLAEFGFFNALNGQDTLEQVLAKAMEDGLICDALIAQNEAQAAQFLRLRESLSAAQKSEGLALKHDLSVPVAEMAKFIDEASQKARRIIPGCRVFAFGHVGDGNVHFNVLQPVAMSGQEFANTGTQITDALYALIQRFGGSISAEHGIGIMKKTELAAQKSPGELHLMRTIKAALDPDNIMNPRVLF